MKLTSAGAARTVTGSCHLIETAGKRLLVDCGLFQGDVAKRNREPFPVDPASLDAVLVTHAHLDHVGRLPLLARNGFSGPIHAIRSTRAIAEIILYDSAKIQTEDYERALRHAGEEAAESEEGPALEEPLYGDPEVAATLALFKEAAFDSGVDLGNGVRATFKPAGHILGSAFIEIESPEGRVIASGDLGNRESGLQSDAVPPPKCDAVLIETTYADRNHRSRSVTVDEFRTVLKESLAAGGNVMIPSFALERTQVVLHTIRNLMRAGEVPHAPVFVDSPMATKMTALYETCANEFLPEIAAALANGEDPFEPEGLKYTPSVEESKKVNEIEGGAIIVAGSGMMTGGRIVHHLKHNLWRKEASLIVVGYQAAGTLGRRIVDGAKTVRIHGQQIEVRARVATINGFSSHADHDDLLAWLEPTGSARVFLVHGEPPVMETFAGHLRGQGREIVIPEQGTPYDLI
ncbi:MAG: MBL fold metallo-hydrolase RNA specificity domain-containing protein [Gemmatimonadota bacterium]